MPEATFARKIYQRRKEMKLSLRELARMTGIAASTISRIETGRISPTLDIATKLAGALKLEQSVADETIASIDAGAQTVDGPAWNRSTEPLQVVVYRKLGHTTLRAGIRRDLSRIAVRNGYEVAILLRGTVQLRTNDGFRENLKPGATISCKLIASRTYFAIPAEEAELLWIG